MFRGVVPTLPAKDVERARRFYQDVVGCRIDEAPEEGAIKVHVGDSWMMVYSSAYAGTNQATAVGFGVDDVASAVVELRGRGVRFEDYDFGGLKTEDGILTMPNGQKGAWFRDTEGNIIGLSDM